MLDGALTLVHGREGLRREGQEVAARVREGHATAEAVKERHTKFFFKRLDLRSHVRLHGVHFFSGARVALLFSECAKVL